MNLYKKIKKNPGRTVSHFDRLKRIQIQRGVGGPSQKDSDIPPRASIDADLGQGWETDALIVAVNVSKLKAISWTTLQNITSLAAGLHRIGVGNSHGGQFGYTGVAVVKVAEV